MRAVLYTRVSKDRQQRGKSVTQQEDEARLACATLGWTVVAVFSDNDRSASRYASKKREGYAELRTFLAEHQVDVLVLWEVSRGSRELHDWAGFLNLCRDRGVRIHIVSHGRTYDMGNLRDRKSLQEDGIDAEHESEKTRERILRSVRANAAAGRPHGKLQYGYTRIYSDRGEFVEQAEQPEQATLLREMARRVLAGESLYAVATDLDARGLPSPGARGRGWDPTEVKRLLVNPAYAALRVLRGEVIGPAVWPAIFDDDVHLRLRALLTDPARNNVTDGSVKHLLSGLITCGECGGTRVNPLSNRGYKAYTCRTKFCIAIRTTKIEAFVSDLLIARLERPDARELFAPREDAGARRAAENELQALEARRADYVRQELAGRISMESLVQAEGHLAPLIADARRRAAPAKPTLPALRELTEPGADVRAVWARLDIVARRQVVAETMALRITKGRQGVRVLDPARLGTSRWAGDDKTWAEHWAAD